MGYSVLGDQPYASDADPLGFAAVAERLGDLIIESRVATPFTIGIEASWGRGKSTLMGLLRRELERPREGLEVRTVAFNAWTAEGEDVLAGLVKSVLGAMDPHAIRRALRKEKLISWARLVVVSLAGLLRVGNFVDEAWDRLSADAGTRNQVNDLVRKAMADWAGTTPDRAGNRLLVVFIDDLDRCSPENVLKVFEGLKLYLDAPGFVFVIGYDESVVAEAVAGRGREYVEKVVQIVFRIPAPSDEEVRALLESLLESSGTTRLFDESERQLVIDRNARNPRRMKRFVNRFILDHQLDEESRRDIAPELHVKLLLLETYFPEFARLLLTAERMNPIKQFLDFVDVWDGLRRDQMSDDAPEVFGFYGITPGATPHDSLRLLAEEVPEPFVALAREPEFVSLVGSLDGEQQRQILAKMQRRGAAGSVVSDGEVPQVVSVVFADFVGVTVAGERLDGEGLQRLLSSYASLVRLELERAGGFVGGFVGDGAMALFGVPRPHDDDAERAVRAALAVRDAVAALEVEDSKLGVRLAVMTGEALVGKGMAFGDPINVGARLQTAVPDGRILVGEPTYRATAGVFDYREADPLMMRGRAEPLRTWEPLRVRVATPAAAP